MAISIDELFNEFNLEYKGPIKWNDKFNAKFNGVYIIALTDNPKSKKANPFEFEISENAFENWRREAKDLQIQGVKVDRIGQVTEHLKQFWNSKENILYVGESSSSTNPIEKRVKQFYNHNIGKKGPHTGGYWMKLLNCLENTCIYFAESKNPRETEFKILMKYVEKSVGKSFYEIDNFSKYFPFANIKVDVLKKHEIKNHTNKNKRHKKV